ncbi:Hypothetical predicted protein [Octopus vulgaris]|uniref:Uncharacterized protein n=1 Tax=Octopus vulgaris TaxID=6645 RepID=A0AA36AU43_OCTVU|nr:Hypothetical predicted protein [Octopus vulgaris]
MAMLGPINGARRSNNNTRIPKTPPVEMEGAKPRGHHSNVTTDSGKDRGKYTPRRRNHLTGNRGEEKSPVVRMWREGLHLGLLEYKRSGNYF